MLELSSQALSTSNDIVFNFLLISLSKLRTLEPAFSHMQMLSYDQTNTVVRPHMTYKIPSNTTTLTGNIRTV